MEEEVKEFPVEPFSLFRANRTLKTEYKPIKLEDGRYDEEIKGLTKKEFIFRFLDDYHQNVFTVYTDNGDRQVKRLGRRRSLGDICLLVKHYYGKAHLGEIKKLLIELIEESRISTAICPDIKRRVFYSKGEWGGRIHHADRPDEFGWTLKEKSW